MASGIPQNSRLRAIFALLALFAFLLIGAGLLVRGALKPNDPRSGERIVIEVSHGESPGQITRKLETEKIVGSARILYWIGRVNGAWGRVKAGEYEFSPAMPALKILETLTSGISVSHPFLVREGENIYEIAEDVQAKGYGSAKHFLVLAKSPAFIEKLGFNPPTPASLEGYLFPDTYGLQRKMTQEEILRLMVKRFQAAWGANEEQRAKELGMDRNRLITLASVVEKETGAPEERPIIAGAFYNRLKKGMKLQSDPTIIYGIWERYHGKIHKSDILAPSAYNTYVIPGLPIGPISNPGAQAIHAVLYPAEHHFLYFVSHNDGTHEFTSTYEEHAAAVRKFQLDPAAREGKSWRDLNKRPLNPKPTPRPNG